jgi:Zn-dependent M28 family amino/carboxypeptidase
MRFFNQINPGTLVLGFFLFPGFWGFAGGETNKITASPEKLLEHVSSLSSISPGRNFENPGQLEKAATYIEAQLLSYGLNPENQTFLVEGKVFRNIVVRFGKKEGKLLVIGAHYDTCGEQPGADDNASGVAGLLEISALLAKLPQQELAPVELVFYTLEEPPNFRTSNMGSYVHAASLAAKGIKIRGMISLEMIGYFTEEKGSQKFPLRVLKLFYPSRGNFIAFVGKTGQGHFVRRAKRKMRGPCPVSICTINAPSKIPGIDFSDHLNYWKFGYKAMMITDTSFYRNFEYHKNGDTPERLDYKKMAGVVEGVIQYILKT